MNNNRVKVGESNGGYLVPKYIWIPAAGTKARLQRTIGALLGRSDWYQKGMERYEFAAMLTEILRMKNSVEVKSEIHLPK